MPKLRQVSPVDPYAPAYSLHMFSAVYSSHADLLAHEESIRPSSLMDPRCGTSFGSSAALAISMGREVVKHAGSLSFSKCSEERSRDVLIGCFDDMRDLLQEAT